MEEHEVAMSLADFHSKYRAAKKNTAGVKTLSKTLLEPIEAEISRTEGIACRAGCSYCCHLRVVAFSFEIVAIYFQLVSKLNQQELKEFKIRLQKQFELIRDLTMEEHFVINVQCPMLENNRCMVYEVRPVACGGYHSLALNDCVESYEHPEITDVEEGSISMAMPVKEEQQLRNSIAYTILEQERDDPNQYELIRSLWSLFQQPSLIQRWKDGRRIFQSPG